jgi:sigma-E factor negative regulatory protein RseB
MPTSFPSRIWLVTAFCAIAVSAHAGDSDARDWLERMAHALATRNYDGKFFHLSESQSEAMRIVHRVRDGRVVERLVSLDGSGREIIRNEHEVVCYLPDKRTVLVEKRTDDNPLLAALPSYTVGLESHYEIRTLEQAKVLGRRTQLVAVTPRDDFRYGYRLWLDLDTAMPLKSQLCDRDGRVIEQILFAELDLKDDIDDEALEPSVAAKNYTWLRQDGALVADRNVPEGWQVATVPAGFELTASRVQHIAGTTGPVRHLVFSDGLASVSVFIEESTGKEPLEGLSRLGSAFAFSTAREGHQITAVGEVPAATVEMIAGAVQKTEASVDASPP